MIEIRQIPIPSVKTENTKFKQHLYFLYLRTLKVNHKLDTSISHLGHVNPGHQHTLKVHLGTCTHSHPYTHFALQFVSASLHLPK